MASDPSAPADVEHRFLVVTAHRRGHHAAKAAYQVRTPHALGYLGVLVALWVLNAADLAVTLHWTDAAGWVAEGNLLMRSVAEATGTLGFAVYKLVLMSVVVVVLWWLYLKVELGIHRARRPSARYAARAGYVAVHAATGLLVAFYGWVLWNNLRVAGHL